MDRVLIAGCGDIGRRTARLWGARGVAVHGLARSPRTAARFARQGIVPVSGDLDHRGTLRLDAENVPLAWGRERIHAELDVAPLDPSHSAGLAASVEDDG